MDLDPHIREQVTDTPVSPDLRQVKIPANTYPHQPEGIHTVGADVFLVARADLPEDVAFAVLDALFGNLADLHLAHPKAQATGTPRQ